MKRHIINAVLAVVGIASFVALFDESWDASLGQIVAIKLFAILGLVACSLIARKTAPSLFKDSDRNEI